MSALSPWDKRLKRKRLTELMCRLNYLRACFMCGAIGLCRHREPQLLPDAEWREA